MDEEEFDFLMPFRRFGTAEATRLETRLRRCATLAVALWGRTPEDLRRRLLVLSPEIPAGFDLEDFRELQRSAQLISSVLGDPRYAWMPPLSGTPANIVVGSQRFTMWEARFEILQRAIEYLEGR